MAGDTNDRSFSNRLLSLEMTATLKPKHTHTHGYTHAHKQKTRHGINLWGRQTKAAPFNAKTFELNPVHMKVSVIAGAQSFPKRVHQGHPQRKCDAAADGHFLLRSNKEATRATQIQSQWFSHHSFSLHSGLKW